MVHVNFVRGEPTWVGLHFLRPLTAGFLVEEVLGRRMVVYPDLVAEFSSKEHGYGNTKNLAGKIPQRHLNAASRPHQIVSRTVGSSAGKAVGPSTQLRIDGIDAEWVLSD